MVLDRADGELASGQGAARLVEGGAQAAIGHQHPQHTVSIRGGLTVGQCTTESPVHSAPLRVTPIEA